MLAEWLNSELGAHSAAGAGSRPGEIKADYADGKASIVVPEGTVGHGLSAEGNGALSVVHRPALAGSAENMHKFIFILGASFPGPDEG